MRYQVLVNFDNYESTDEERKTYFSVLNKYHALGIGNSGNKTSTMLIDSDTPLTKDDLAKDLGDLEILSFRIDSLRKTHNLN
ncbi:MAG: hypothetical protein WD876_00215 [Candidatus Pacearchaeota archaeon]